MMAHGFVCRRVLVFVGYIILEEICYCCCADVNHNYLWRGVWLRLFIETVPILDLMLVLNSSR